MAENDFARIAALADLPTIASNYTTVKPNGKEYKATCVFHKPDDDPSLTFFQKGGKWRFKCHAAHCGESGDAIDWIEKLESLDTPAAAKFLNGGKTWAPKIAAPPKAATPPDRITSKPPAGIAAPNCRHREYGEPSSKWEYRDTDGAILGYVARYDVDGKKEIIPWTWGARGTAQPSWGAGQFNTKRPLYNLHLLAANPKTQVLLVEGEKTADAAAKLLSDCIPVTWPGGANAWKKADLGPLRGREVVCWPDNDAGGIKCMKDVGDVISDKAGLACQVQMIDPSRSDKPEGWDLADEKDWDSKTAIAWARERISKWPPEPTAAPALASPGPEQQTAPHAEINEPDTPVEEEEDEPLPASMSEDMLADKFAEKYRETWRYVKKWGSWVEWQSDHWAADDVGKIDFLAVRFIRTAIYWPEAAALTPEAKRRVDSKRTAGSVRDIALSDPRISAKVDQWDTDSMLLGVPGGVVDLATGKTKTPRPMDYIMRRTSVAPAQGSPKLWLQFLDRVTSGSAELIGFLKRFGGYALTGDTSEQCLAFLYGTGQNGKGTYIAALSNILGEYAISAEADVFMESDHQRHSTEIARMRGARLVYVDETDNAKRWNEKRIKRITGGGKIEARFMRQDDFEFQPQFKLLIAGNDKPQLRGVGKAIQRRIQLVPFTVEIPDAEKDKHLQDKLETEYPQILSWFIEGCIEWQQIGLAAPELVRDATTKYIQSEDVIGDWLEECAEQKGDVARPIAYKNYRAWADGRGERAWGSKAFSAALEGKGYQASKSHGTWMIRGLSLKRSDAERPSYDY